jgi:hypothetical protein
MRGQQKLFVNQQGFASIVIALIFILVMSLLTVAFAQLARREQQHALDKQLSNQAYYAAETGINDITKAIGLPSTDPNHIDDAVLASVGYTDSNDCVNLQLLPMLRSHINDNADVSYTCEMINLKPRNLQKGLNADGAWSVVFSSDNALNQLNIQWTSQNAAVNSNPRTTEGFPPANQWSSPAVLEFSLTPLNNDLQRGTLISKNMTVYLYPRNATGSTLATSVNYQTVVSNKNSFNGDIIGRCTGGATNICSAQITNLVGNGTGPYLLHMVSHYDPNVTNVNIGGVDINNNAVSFIGAQAQIDSTGRARNVLKRIRVAVPLTNSKDIPSYALEVQNICKRFQSEPAGTEYSPAGTFDAGPSCVLGPP